MHFEMPLVGARRGGQSRPQFSPKAARATYSITISGTGLPVGIYFDAELI
jgi:hypothetical protein